MATIRGRRQGRKPIVKRDRRASVKRRTARQTRGRGALPHGSPRVHYDVFA